jgi:hypothetical protein
MEAVNPQPHLRAAFGVRVKHDTKIRSLSDEILPFAEISRVSSGAHPRAPLSATWDDWPIARRLPRTRRFAYEGVNLIRGQQK